MEIEQYLILQMQQTMNDNKFLTYSTKVMGATDAFGLLIARAKAKEKAMREQWIYKVSSY